jgi:hypothetical protein
MNNNTFRIVRVYVGDHPKRTIKKGLTEAKAVAHCRDPESSSRTCKLPKNVAHTLQFGQWWDGYADD